MNFKKILSLAAIALVMALVGYQSTFAQTDTYDAGAKVGPDLTPNCITFSGTDPGNSTLTVSLPKNFVPKFAFWVDNATAGDAPLPYLWIKGMSTTATVAFIGGSAAFSMRGDVNTDTTTTAGSFVIDADAITDDHAYYGYICQ